MGADNAALLAIEQRMAAKPLAAVVSYSGDSTRQESESVLHAGENGLMAGVGVITGSELAFFFSGDCWIKVVDGDDRVIYEAVAKANASLELKGQPPFKVTLGYAPAVQVSYNGEPVEIDTRQGRNVARLVLGS
jgi:cytoskeleton protein RodZ